MNRAVFGQCMGLVRPSSDPSKANRLHQVSSRWVGRAGTDDVGNVNAITRNLNQSPLENDLVVGGTGIEPVTPAV